MLSLFYVFWLDLEGIKGCTDHMMNYQRAYFSAVGNPAEVLGIESVALPVLQAGELCVRMIAAPVNPADINFVQGVYGIKPVLPSGAGLEGVGRVEQSLSSDFLVGDVVITLSGVGSWAEYQVAPASQFLKVRGDIEDLAQVAMLKVNPLTAWRALMGYRSLKPGDWVVQNAANSGVGRCFIQLAKSMGLRTINLVRRDSLIPELEALGGDIVLVDEKEATAKMLDLTGGARPVLASNCVGGDSATRLMDMLAPQGTMVTFGAMSKQSIKVPNGFLIFKGVELKGLWVTQWLKNAPREEVVAAYASLADLMAKGKLSQAIEGEYALSSLTEAVTRAQEDERGGKVLLRLGGK